MALTLLFLFFLLRVLLRRDWAAAALFVLLTVVAATVPDSAGLSGWSLAIQSAASVVIVVAGVFLLLRFGLLAFAAALAFDQLLTSFPITTQTSAWYFETGLTGVVLLLGLAGYAFYTSLGGQPLFGRALIEDGR